MSLLAIGKDGSIGLQLRISPKVDLMYSRPPKSFQIFDLITGDFMCIQFTSVSGRPFCHNLCDAFGQSCMDLDDERLSSRNAGDLHGVIKNLISELFH